MSAGVCRVYIPCTFHFMPSCKGKRRTGANNSDILQPLKNGVYRLCTHHLSKGCPPFSILPIYNDLKNRVYKINIKILKIIREERRDTDQLLILYTPFFKPRYMVQFLNGVIKALKWSVHGVYTLCTQCVHSIFQNSQTNNQTIGGKL